MVNALPIGDHAITFTRSTGQTTGDWTTVALSDASGRSTVLGADSERVILRRLRAALFGPREEQRFVGADEGHSMYCAVSFFEAHHTVYFHVDRAANRVGRLTIENQHGKIIFAANFSAADTARWAELLTRSS